MNKLIISILIFSFLLLGSVSAGNVIYIYKTTQSIQQGYINAIQELGHTVDTRIYSGVGSINFDDYDMILVGDGHYSNAASFPVNQHNTLIANSWDSNLRAWGWSDYVSALASNRPLHAENDLSLGHRITEGLNMDIQIYTDSCCVNPANIPVYYLSRFDRARGMTVVTSTVDESDPNDLDSVVAITEPGRTLRLGTRVTTQSNARGAFFGVVYSSYWTQESEELFKNTVEWLISGVDNDGDGWFSDEDCDDTNNLIYPGASEIPYNDIDEDCNGFDLLDDDNDGYCLSGVAIADASVQCPSDGTVGSDCDDENSLVNPGSSNPELDCVNEAPSLDNNIEDQVLDEDETLDIDLSLIFSDADGDSLSYSVLGNVNIQVSFNGDTATITPDGDWNGNENLIISASDGSLTTDSNEFNVLVNPVNDAPVLEFISDISVMAGDLVTITPSASDVDGDSLSFSFSSPLDSNGEWQTTLDDLGSYIASVTVSDGVLEDSQEFIINVVSKLIINEFTVDPQQDWDESGSITPSDEWFEIYNPSSSEIDLTGWELRTIDSDTNIEVLTGILNSGDYLVILNPTGSQNLDGRLELYNNDILVDSVSYGDWDDGDITDNAVDGNANDLTDECLARDPNGQDTDQDNLDWIKKACTYGINNEINVLAPIVILESPGDGAVLDVDDVSLVYSVSDNDASVLDCDIYTDVSGTFGITGSQDVEEGGSSIFVLNDLSQGSYRWNVECSDGVNSAFALGDFSFTIDIPEVPVLEFIQDIIVNEGELVVITASASDPDNDPLVFSIDDPRFTQNDNVFSWQTGFGDEGVYTVTVTVSDGSLEDSQEVQIFVGDVNLPPVLDNNIPDQVLDEDETLDIDLSLIFSDADGDSLSYSVLGNVNIQVSFNGNTATITPDGDWNGDEDLIITASDGSLTTDSNEFNVLVNPVNDAPRLISNIPNQNLDEDESLLNAFNLNDYFNDVDGDSLSFSVSGNSNIQVVINGDGSVDIIPDSEFSGSETVVFSASDGVLSADSNSVAITVNSVNDLPVFEDIPDQTILEDSGFNGPINFVVNDPDGSVEGIFLLNEELSKVDCSVSDSILSLTTVENYFGSASCTIRAVDNDGGFSDKIVNINVVGVNDAPVIDSFSPSFNPVISDIGTQLFRITKSDVDNPASELLTEWFVDGVLKGIADDFIFRASNYDVVGSQVFSIEARVSDLDTSVSRTWQLTVDESVEEQTCGQQSGDICSSIETCNGDWLSASDTTRCCSITCSSTEPPEEEPPEEISLGCSNGIIGDLSLKIREPDNGDDFKIRDIIDVEVKVDNNADDDMDVVVEASLFDLDSDEEIDDDEQEEEIDDNSDEEFNLELEVENEDVDEDHDFIVFVKAYGDNNEEGQCTEGYVNVDIEREKHELLISELEVSPDKVICGDSLSFNIELENIGEKDEEGVYVQVKNNKLGINEKGNEFDLDSEDDYREKIYVSLLEDAKGSYNFLVDVFYDDKISSKEVSVNVDCDDGLVSLVKEDGIVRRVIPRVSELNIDVKASPLVRAKTCEVIEIPVSVFNPTENIKSYSVELLNIDSWANPVGSRGLLLGGKETGRVVFSPEIKEDASLGGHSALVNVMGEGKLVKSQVVDVDINKGVCKKERAVDLSSLVLIGGIVVLIILLILLLLRIFRK